MASFDGGSTWNEAISYAVANGGGDPAIGPVRFIDAQTGWVAVSPGRIFRTRDGGISWQFIEIDHP
jgi:photosystem II stability/assembly factor-like uncharacterized protein